MNSTVSSNRPSVSVALPMYAVVDGRAASLGTDEVVFYDSASDRSHVMAMPVIQALDLCRQFQPLDDHIQTICTQLPNMKGQHQAVRRVLESLVQRGILISDDGFIKQLYAAEPTTPAPVVGLFVRACDRPVQLSNLLKSLLDQQRRFSALGRLVVVDDSKQGQSIEAHAELLRDFAKEWTQSVHHVTPTLWAAWAERLVAQTGGGEALRRALLRDPRHRGARGGGEGRNLITLLAAGGRYLLFDDDHLLPMRRHPNAKPMLAPPAVGIAIGTYSSMQQALEAGIEPDEDPLQLHLDLCGRRLGECLAKAHSVVFGLEQLRGFAPSREPWVRADTRVLMTQHGHRGASCSSGTSGLFLLDELARLGYAGRSEDYARLRGDAPLWFGTSHYVLDKQARFPGFAIDNSTLMPCTTPYGRGEDALFNALALATDKNAVQMHIPMSVGHLPEGGRDRSPSIGKAISPDVSLCLTDLVEDIAPTLRAERPERRLAAISAGMRDLAGASNASLTSYLRALSAQRRAELVEKLKAVVATPTQACAEWQQDLRTHLEVNAKAIVARNLPAFPSMSRESSAQECLDYFRRETEVVAAALDVWPAAWEAALEEQAECLEQARVSP